MDKVIAGVLFLALAVFVGVILGTLLGGVVGVVVGWVFPAPLHALKGLLHISVTNFQLGAMLGFVSGFFKSSSSSSSK